MICVYFMMRAPESSTESISGEAGNRTCDPWFSRPYYTTTALSVSFGRVKFLRTQNICYNDRQLLELIMNNSSSLNSVCPKFISN